MVILVVAMEDYMFFVITIVVISVLIVVVQRIYTMSMAIVFSCLIEQICFHFNQRSCFHMTAHTSYKIHMYVYKYMLGCKLCQNAPDCKALLWLK